MTNTTYPRQILISNVELNWAKLDTPVSPFGKEIYELQIATDDSEIISSLEADGFKLKENNGKSTVSLKRNAQKRDGSDNAKVRVVGADKAPLTSPIGNGSTGNVIVLQYEYDMLGNKGVASSLVAVQVTDLVQYSGGTSVDFDVVGGPGGDAPF